MNTIQSNADAMRAFVLQVKERELRVCDCSTLRELLIHTAEAAHFCAGDRIHIEYSGACSVRRASRIREHQISRITRF